MKIAIFSYPKRQGDIGVIRDISSQADIENIFNKAYFGRLTGQLEAVEGGWIFTSEFRQEPLPPKLGHTGWRGTPTTISGGFEKIKSTQTFWIEKR